MENQQELTVLEGGNNGNQSTNKPKYKCFKWVIKYDVSFKHAEKILQNNYICYLRSNTMWLLANHIHM